jgi:short chain dehydrogenase
MFINVRIQQTHYSQVNSQNLYFFDYILLLFFFFLFFSFFFHSFSDFSTFAYLSLTIIMQRTQRLLQHLSPALSHALAAPQSASVSATATLSTSSSTNCVSGSGSGDFKQSHIKSGLGARFGSLKGKTIFLTGGSRGIGLAIAKACARDGANVIIAAKTVTPHPKYASSPSGLSLCPSVSLSLCLCASAPLCLF